MDKNKYQSHRYRFVVRFTNTRVITQVIYSEISGDRVLVRLAVLPLFCFVCLRVCFCAAQPHSLRTVCLCVFWCPAVLALLHRRRRRPTS